MNEKDMGQTDMENLLSRIVYKTPDNLQKERIGEILAHKRMVIRRHEAFRLRLARWSIAASIMLGVTLGGTTLLSQTALASRTQELACTLPDGTEVTIMPDSDLSYNTFTWRFNRKVSLSGEAIFSVTPGRRFSVKTQAGKVSVLGTRFRVKQDEYVMLVECYKGIVKVKTPVGEEVLVAGQKAKCDTEAILLSEIEAPLPPIISFKAVPLKEVVLCIEEIFDVAVSGYDKYSDLVFTGFIVTSDLDETLEAVLQSCDIRYEVSGHKITLK